MYKMFFLFMVTISVQSNLFSQHKMTWNDLTDVTFNKVYSAAYDDFFLKPTFGSSVKSYRGVLIRVKGYFLDFSTGEDQFHLLSKNPMSSCFFCGGAGPETIIEVVYKQKPNFKTDQIVEVTGILELNTDDVDHCNYIIKEATSKLINK